jgi:septal ring factor EnvC (AmiA/AmiB activator)
MLNLKIFNLINKHRAGLFTFLYILIIASILFLYFSNQTTTQNDLLQNIIKIQNNQAINRQTLLDLQDSNQSLQGQIDVLNQNICSLQKQLISLGANPIVPLAEDCHAKSTLSNLNSQ